MVYLQGLAYTVFEVEIQKLQCEAYSSSGILRSVGVSYFHIMVSILLLSA